MKRIAAGVLEPCDAQPWEDCRGAELEDGEIGVDRRAGSIWGPAMSAQSQAVCCEHRWRDGVREKAE